MAALNWASFYLPRKVRTQFGFRDYLVEQSGELVVPRLSSLRTLVYTLRRAGQPIGSVGELNALTLLHLSWEALITRYRTSAGVGLRQLAVQSGGLSLAPALRTFLTEFPPALENLDGPALLDDPVVQERALGEFVNLWLKNQNPAAQGLKILFDDRELASQSDYRKVLTALRGDCRPGSDGDWLDELLEPVRAHPDSLDLQLAYIMKRWPELGDTVPFRLILQGQDLLKEERRPAFDGPGPIAPPTLPGGEGEVNGDRFTADQDWMPSLVLMAKNVFVWLDQLTREHGRPIEHLDQIPDSALDELQQRGVTGLWLIGVWERSPASKRIKQRMGAEDAVASAYSLYDYTIAQELGGSNALADLRARAWARGIRLGSDMVPNHMGVDSRWVIEYPERFLSLPETPFPSYSFNGENLCTNDGVEIYLEDHYYDRSDAAVVFKRVERGTGQARYIYHGNDGTNMPWNDTAQLDYLQAEVREAVIQTIIEVARQFPILRFDAAMTLARKHVQRLWFPEPGTGGDIASRAVHGLTRQEFDARMPREFWQEVVERVAIEAPDTLLLAEAFWMMEGYFVRTLGMHRVYNSAFMHMVRDERNREYRQAIKDTLAFNPEILKRYVNFLNNPDEDTAVEQFGRGDKYFAACTLMATLPGLPMLGHGQLEGFAEKYGMEYRYAKQHEQPDSGLLERHAQQIFPLLRARRLFAGVDAFQFYDVFGVDGIVQEPVYAFSNSFADQKALVLVNNSPDSVTGRIHADVSELGGATLAAALQLPQDGVAFVIAREQNSGLEYLWNCAEVAQHGLEIHLGPYQAQIFLDFRIEYAHDNLRYWDLHSHLAGKGVRSIGSALDELMRAPVLTPFRELLRSPVWQQLMDRQPDGQRAVEELVHSAEPFLRALNSAVGGSADLPSVLASFGQEVGVALQLADLVGATEQVGSRNFKAAAKYLEAGMLRSDLRNRLLIALLLRRIGQCSGAPHYWEVSRGWVREWRLYDPLTEFLAGAGLATAQIEALIGAVEWHPLPGNNRARLPAGYARGWLADSCVRAAIGANAFEGVVWFGKEALEEWLWLTMAWTAVQILCESPPVVATTRLAGLYGRVRKLEKLALQSGYRQDRLESLWGEG